MLRGTKIFYKEMHGTDYRAVSDAIKEFLMREWFAALK